MEIIQSILNNNPCFKAGKKIRVLGLMLHSVGCPQPSAEVFVKKWNNQESGRACVHAFIDGNTGKVYQTLPWDHRAWHCGGSGNNTYIGVEMCEPAYIKYTGGSTFTCSDEASAVQLVKRTYDTAVELFAGLCKQYGLDPLADGVIVSHKEGHDRGIASGHGDPEHLWTQLKTGYTMDGFRTAVKEAMAGMSAAAQTEGAVSEKKETAADAEGAKEDKEEKNPANAQPGGGKFQAGDTVGLAPDAEYYTGGDIPLWVKTDTWIVKSVSGDRAVIDRNTDGTRAICSPVNVKYLTVVPAGQAPTPVMPTEREITGPDKKTAAAPPPVCPAQTDVGPAEKISERGVDLIAKYEGCRLEAYKCPVGVWTIGYGHTAGVKQGDTLPSKEAAKALLAKDLEKYAGYVGSCVKKGLIGFALNQNQFDALTSFAYNCGNGSLQKLVTGRDAATIADKLLLYNKGGGRVLPGLTKRREEERELFLS